MRRTVPVLAVAFVASGLWAFAESRKVLFEGTSAYNDILVTEDGLGRRFLQFEHGGALQSVVKPGQPRHLELLYTRASMAGLAYLDGPPRRALVVGLGGAAMPMFLRSAFPRATVDVVEIDPLVHTVATRFFGLEEGPQLTVHVADARAFVESRAAGQYDVVFLDAYGPRSIPRHLATREFLAAVQRTLTPRGVVVANVWQDPNPLAREMLATYVAVFRSVEELTFPGRGDRIILAMDGPRPPREVLVERGHALGKRLELDFDPGDILRTSLRPWVLRPGTPVLTDDGGWPLHGP